MDDEIFVVSDMTVEVHDFPTGKVIGFNGTTEWALDSLAQGEVVWLPREDQLRELIGATSTGSRRCPAGLRWSQPTTTASVGTWTSMPSARTRVRSSIVSGKSVDRLSGSLLSWCGSRSIEESPRCAQRSCSPRRHLLPTSRT